MAQKKVKAKVTIVTEEPKTLWQRFKDFFYNSGNLMWNWLLGAIGTVGATMAGIFTSMDWSRPLEILRSGTSFTKEQWFMIGLGALLSGIIGYATRVSGTKVVDGHLLPKVN